MKQIVQGSVMPQSQTAHFALPKPLRVSLVEDHRGTRATLTRTISCLSGVEFLAAYANAEAALDRLPRESPHVLLMDLQLPRLSGVECTRLLLRRVPDLKIVVLTKFDEIENIVGALKAGAVGFLTKPANQEDLPRQLVQAYLGQSPLSPAVGARLVRYVIGDSEPSDQEYGLSSRELEILNLLAAGKSDKMIANHLNLSRATVNFHTRNLYEKLDVHSRTQAIAKYFGKLR